MWFLHNGVILTKDNLASRRWQGCKKCCFCYQEETIQHLFQVCPFATLVWWIKLLIYHSQLAWRICLVTGWGEFPLHLRHKYVLVFVIYYRHYGIAVMNSSWTNTNFQNFLQVIYRATNFCAWSTLLRVEDSGFMDFGCNRLEMVARDFFNRVGWRSNDRIGDWVIVSC